MPPQKHFKLFLLLLFRLYSMAMFWAAGKRRPQNLSALCPSTKWCESWVCAWAKPRIWHHCCFLEAQLLWYVDMVWDNYMLFFSVYSCMKLLGTGGTASIVNRILHTIMDYLLDGIDMPCHWRMLSMRTCSVDITCLTSDSVTSFHV